MWQTFTLILYQNNWPMTVLYKSPVHWLELYFLNTIELPNIQKCSYCYQNISRSSHIWHVSTAWVLKFHFFILQGSVTAAFSPKALESPPWSGHDGAARLSVLFWLGLYRSRLAGPILVKDGTHLHRSSACVFLCQYRHSPKSASVRSRGTFTGGLSILLQSPHASLQLADIERYWLL